MDSKDKIPTQLYKHMAITNNLYKTLINSELWFASPKSFNDPFDCKVNDITNWNVDLINDYINNSFSEEMNDKKRSSILKHPEILRKSFQHNLDENISEIGVTCFLPNPKNLLLWAHYSDKHTGVCLRFDIREDPELFKHTYQVNYTNIFPTFDYQTQKLDIVKIAVLSKSKAWKYEKEVRSIQNNFGNHPFNKKCLKEIIFGCKTEPNEIKTIINIVKNAGYPNVKFFKTTLLDNQYGIDIKKITRQEINR